MDIQDILGNDVRLVDNTVRTVSEAGISTMKFPGEFMPDGRDFVGEAPGKLDATILREWCNAVRREYDARIRSQEAKALDAARRRDENGAGPGGVTQEPESGSRHSAKDGAAGQEDLEANLQAQVSYCARREREAAAEVDRASAALASARLAYDAASVAYRRASRTLDFYLGDSHGAQDSGADSE